MSDDQFSRSLNITAEDSLDSQESTPTRPRRHTKSKVAQAPAKKVQFNISLDADLATQLRLASLIEDRPVSEIVSNCLRSKIKLAVYEVTKKAG